MLKYAEQQMHKKTTNGNIYITPPIVYKQQQRLFIKQQRGR